MCYIKMVLFENPSDKTITVNEYQTMVRTILKQRKDAQLLKERILVYECYLIIFLILFILIFITSLIKP
jgi:hypothetical protein